MYNLAIYNLRLKSHLELIDTVDVRFHRCRDNIRIGTEPIINMIIVFHLHMYLTHIVATLADSLDSEFLQCHMASIIFFKALIAASTGPFPLAAASNFSPEMFNPKLATERTPTPLVT